MKQFISKTQKTGELGENICAAYLIKLGFSISERNYSTKNGEIDIIAIKNDVTHFIEVKSISLKKSVSHETYNPAENLTKQKYQKIVLTVGDYLSENNVSHETNWQIDLYCIYIDQNKKNHKVSVLENLIIE